MINLIFSKLLFICFIKCLINNTSSLYNGNIYIAGKTFFKASLNALISLNLLQISYYLSLTEKKI